MSHHLEPVSDWDGPRLKLVCTAALDAPCRRRPADWRDRGDGGWSIFDPDLTPGWDCWAVEFISDGGWETALLDGNGDWPTIPVSVSYDEGVILTPEPSPTITDHLKETS